MNPVDLTLRGVFSAALPEIVLVAGACLLFLGAVIRGSRHLWGGIALITLLTAGWVAWQFPAAAPSVPSVATIVTDPFSQLVRWLALGVGIVLVLMCWDHTGETTSAEFHACLLVLTAGMSLCGSVNDLVLLFLALEFVSIPSYILLYLPRKDRLAQEAALKYFLLSVFSSAVMLFGFSYLYGLAGTTNLNALFENFPAPRSGVELPAIAVVALVMVTAGLGYKITAVPFHFYAPDVYQGSPPVVAGVLAVAPKIAGFAALARALGFVHFTGMESAATAFGQSLVIFWIIAAVTMTVGNVLAVLQDNVKRMLAYSSVAHAGYMLMGLAIAPQVTNRDAAIFGIDAILFYLAAYAAMTLSVFTTIAYFSTTERPIETIDDLAGIGRTHPFIGGLTAISLLSLIGLPLTAGFVGKLFLFLGAVALPSSDEMLAIGQYQALVLIAAINAAIGAYYYLRVLAVMYSRQAIQPLAPRRSVPTFAGLTLCAIATLGFGTILADPLRTVTRKAGSPPGAQMEPPARAER